MSFMGISQRKLFIRFKLNIVNWHLTAWKKTFIMNSEYESYPYENYHHIRRNVRNID